MKTPRTICRGVNKGGFRWFQWPHVLSSSTFRFSQPRLQKSWSETASLLHPFWSLGSRVISEHSKMIVVYASKFRVLCYAAVVTETTNQPKEFSNAVQPNNSSFKNDSREVSGRIPFFSQWQSERQVSLEKGMGQKYTANTVVLKIEI